MFLSAACCEAGHAPGSVTSTTEKAAFKNASLVVVRRISFSYAGRPEECARERWRHGEAHVCGSLDDVFHLLDGPFAAGFGIAAYFGGGKAVEDFVVSGMRSNELPLDVRGKFSDDETVGLAFDFIAIGL